MKVVATNAELQAVATGDVDIEEDVVCENDYIEEGKSYGFINMWVQETLGYGYVAVNHKLEKFQDPKVRQALLYAIDRKSLNNVVYGEYANALNIPQARVDVYKRQEENFSCFEAGEMWDIYTSIPPAMGMFCLVKPAREKAFCIFSLPA